MADEAKVKGCSEGALFLRNWLTDEAPRCATQLKEETGEGYSVRCFSEELDEGTPLHARATYCRVTKGAPREERRGEVTTSSLAMRVLSGELDVDVFLLRHHGIETPRHKNHYAPLHPAPAGTGAVVVEGTSYRVQGSRRVRTADGHLLCQSLLNRTSGNLLLCREISDGGAEMSASIALPADEGIVGFLRGNYNRNDREDLAFMTSAHRLIVVDR